MGEVLEEKKKPKSEWLMIFLIGMTIISALVMNKIYGKEFIEIIRPYGLTIIQLFIIFTCLGLSKWSKVLTGSGSLWIGIGYGISLVLILIAVKFPIYNLWFLGAALIGIFVHEYLGIAMQFVLTYLYCGLNEYSLEQMLFYFILGAMICFLGKYLYKTSTMIYVTIIVLSCNVIFVFVMNSFIFQNSLSENTVYSIASTFAVILSLFGAMTFKGQKEYEVVSVEIKEEDALGKVYIKADVETVSLSEPMQEESLEIMPETILETPQEEEIKEEKEEVVQIVEETADIKEEPVLEEEKEEPVLVEEAAEPKEVVEEELYQMNIDWAAQKEAVYNKILDEDYELLQQLREKSPSLYAHSKKVAELASDGAIMIDADEQLAKAGGLYHEIGRLVSKDYIEAGMLLLEEHEFPRDVISILCQQNAKVERPKSKEAVIVMLSESIVSTITYLEREKKKAKEAGMVYKEQPLNKVVENIIDIRFSKGSLDESGITIMEYKTLKNYYMELYS